MYKRQIVQASDSFGDATSPTSFVVFVDEADSSNLGSNDGGLPITLIAIVVGIAALIAGLVVYFRYNQPPNQGQDRFGFQ